MKKKLFVLLLLGQILSQVQAQTMTVRSLSGAPAIFNIVNIKKITFSSGNAIIKNTTGSDAIFSLAGNSNIVFTASALNTATKSLVRNSFYVYENPETSILTITNTDASAVITDYDIIAIDGRVMKSKHNINKSEEQVVVSDLPSGVYICRITSKQQAQTIKFLKQ